MPARRRQSPSIAAVTSPKNDRFALQQRRRHSNRNQRIGGRLSPKRHAEALYGVVVERLI
jgi:hypothetical protein